MSNSLWPHGLNSLPGSCVFVISQVRILEWVAISCSRGSSWLRDGTCVSFIGRWILSHQGSHRVCSMMRKVEKYKQWMLYLQSLSFAKSDALHHHSSRVFFFFFQKRLKETELKHWVQIASQLASVCFHTQPYLDQLKYACSSLSHPCPSTLCLSSFLFPQLATLQAHTHFRQVQSGISPKNF